MYLLNILKQRRLNTVLFFSLSRFFQNQIEVSISALCETKLVQATRVTQTVFSFFSSQKICFFRMLIFTEDGECELCLWIH